MCKEYESGQFNQDNAKNQLCGNSCGIILIKRNQFDAQIINPRTYTYSRWILRCIKYENYDNPFYDIWIYDIQIDPIKWLVLIKMFDIGAITRHGVQVEKIIGKGWKFFGILANCKAVLKHPFKKS